MIPTRALRFPALAMALLALTVSFKLVPSALAQAGAAPLVPAREFDKLLKEKRYLELEAALKTPQAQQLSKVEREYFAGIIANRRNRLEESIALLKGLVDMSAAPPSDSAAADSGLTREQQKTALRALGDSYTKSFRYPDAAAAYEQAERRFTNATTDEERHELRLEKEFRDLLRNQAAQTASVEAPFTVQGRRSQLGLLEVEVKVAADKASTEKKPDPATGTGQSEDKEVKSNAGDWWIVDTGANFSTITRSTAERLGLKLSDSTTHVRGSTGAESRLHLAIIPELRIGKATVRNVAALVLDDQNLYIPPVKYQIHGILGAPVLMALGRITFFADERFGVGQAGASGPSNMMMEELTPLVEASTYSSSEPLLFSFDTGANKSAFYARYYQERKPEFAKAKRSKRRYGGAGGVKVDEAYRLENVPMEICAGRLTLASVDVNLESTKKTEPEFYGNLGQDILKPFRSLTIDFGSMRCSAE